MSKFNFLPGISATGVAFEIFGRNERVLLENAAQVLIGVIIDPKAVRNRAKELVNLRKISFEELFLGLLTHLIFLRKGRNFIAKEVKVGVTHEDSSWSAQGYVYGEKFDPLHHKLKMEIESFNINLLNLAKVNKAWRAQVVFEG
ncbi:archease [Candidatus Microgenomates bacterium]|nr:archease [Candidatus Microgenomates bacterium]